MATIKDVAKRAGVSTYTVSVALNGTAKVSPELAKRVQDAARALNYTANQVARSLQSRRSRTIGMLIPDMANPFYASVVRGVEDRLRRSGYALLLACTYDRPDEQLSAVSVFVARQVDGLLLFLAPGDEGEVERALVGKPAVFLSRRPQHLQGDVVMPDTVDGTRQSVRNLIDRGHRRIGLLTGPLRLSTNRDRVDGWTTELKKAKLAAPAALTVETDWSPEAGERAAASLLDAPSPVTALVAASFPLLTGALRAVRRRKLAVPTDVALVTSDDYDWLDVFDPPITGVVQPRAEMGDKAAELLLARLEEPPRKAAVVTLPCTLRVRM